MAVAVAIAIVVVVVAYVVTTTSTISHFKHVWPFAHHQFVFSTIGKLIKKKKKEERTNERERERDVDDNMKCHWQRGCHSNNH